MERQWMRAYARWWERLPLTVRQHVAALLAGGLIAALLLRLFGLAWRARRAHRRR